MRKSTAIRILMCSVLMGSSLFLSSCEFGKEPAQTILATATPTPMEVAPTVTPTEIPNLIGTTYRAPDGSFTIEVPDESWTIKAEDTNVASFESAAGTIRILHGKGEGAMSAAVIPDTYDLAVSLEQASGLDAGIDFEIPDYSTQIVGGAFIYDFTVRYTNTTKSSGNAYTVNRYLLSDNEYYSLVGFVKDADALAAIRSSIESFHILTDSPLAPAAPGRPEDAAAPTDEGGVSEAAQGEVQEADTSSWSTGYVDDGSSYSDDQLSDIYQTRTIYRNADGTPIVIVPDGNGGWRDSFGNTYYYVNDEDVYDQNDVDYYWHGEAGDVAFMPIE